jgi:hypothetical protein
MDLFLKDFALVICIFFGAIGTAFILPLLYLSSLTASQHSNVRADMQHPEGTDNL